MADGPDNPESGGAAGPGAEEEATTTLPPGELLTKSLTAILEHVHRHLDPPLPIDDRLLLALLLAVYAGNHNLVLRIGPGLDPAQRTEFRHRVAAQVAWLCQSVFAFVVHHVSCTSRASSSVFLRSIFLPPPEEPSRGGSAPVVPVLGVGGPSPHRKGDRLQRRSLSVPLTGVVGADPKSRNGTPPVRQPSPTRARGPLVGIPLSSQPATYDDSSAGEDLYPTRPISPRQPSPDRRRASNRRVLSRRDSSGGASIPPATQKTPFLSGTYASAPKLGALALSEKEVHRLSPPTRSATVASSRPTSSKPFTSFAAVAGPSRPSTATNSSAPTSAFAVPKTSRPPLLPGSSQRRSPSLLSTASTPSVRRHSAELLRSPAALLAVPRILPQVLIVSRLDRARPSVQQTLLDLLRERRFALSASGAAVGGGGGRKKEDDAASTQTRRTEMGSWEGSFALPKGFFVVAIVSDEDGDDAVHDGAWGGVSRYLFDYFSYSHTVSPSLPSLSYFPLYVPSPPSTPTPPLLPFTSQLLSRSTSLQLAPSLRLYLSDIISAIRHHPHLEARMLTAKTSRNLELFTRLWTVLSRDLEKGPCMVLPSDVLAVLIGVVGHKVRLRAPDKEKSLFWGSSVDALKKIRETEARTVEEVLRSIAAVV